MQAIPDEVQRAVPRRNPQKPVLENAIEIAHPDFVGVRHQHHCIALIRGGLISGERYKWLPTHEIQQQNSHDRFHLALLRNCA